MFFMHPRLTNCRLGGSARTCTDILIVIKHYCRIKNARVAVASCPHAVPTHNHLDNSTARVHAARGVLIAGEN